MTNAPSGAGDRYYVYRPMLDLIGFTEGTDKGDGYNETLAYGAYTGGDVNHRLDDAEGAGCPADQDAPAPEEQVQVVGRRPLADRSHQGAGYPQEAAEAVPAHPQVRPGLPG